MPGMDKWYECGANGNADESGSPLKFAPDFDQLPAPHLYPPPSYYAENDWQTGWNAQNMGSIAAWDEEKRGCQSSTAAMVKR